jgi:hypothetical protein
VLARGRPGELPRVKLAVFGLRILPLVYDFVRGVPLVIGQVLYDSANNSYHSAPVW